MQQLFAEGHGVIYQSIGTWLASKYPQLQLTGALAIANFARNGKKVYSLPITTAKAVILKALFHSIETQQNLHVNVFKGQGTKYHLSII